MKSFQSRMPPVEMVIDRTVFASDADYLSVIDSIRVNNTSKSLNMSNNNLDETIIRRLLNALEINSSLRTVTLSWNKLGSHNIGLLSSLFEINNTIEHIELKNNDINDEGANLIAAALQKNTKLKTLDLRWNLIGDEGASNLLNMIKSSDPSSQHFASAFPGSFKPPFRKIFLQGNYLSPAMLEQFDAINNNLDITSTSKSINNENSSDKENFASLNNSNFNNIHPGKTAPDSSDADIYRRIETTIESGVDVARFRMQLEAIRLENNDLKISLAASNQAKALLDRQLEASSTKVIELEQIVGQNELFSNQQTETIKSLNSRVNSLIEDKRKLSEFWEAERHKLREHSLNDSQAKQTEIQNLTAELSLVSSISSRSSEKIESLQKYIEDLMNSHKLEKETLDSQILEYSKYQMSLVLQDSQSKSEVKSLSYKLNMANDKIKSFDTRLDEIMEKHIIDMKNSQISHAMEVDSLKTHFSKQLELSRQIIDEKTEEVLVLSHNFHKQSRDHTSAVSEMQKACSEEVKKARIQEKTALEASIDNYKKKVDALKATLAEMESKYNGSQKQIRDMSIDNKLFCDKIQVQIKSLESEIASVKCENDILKTQRNSLESENHNLNHSLRLAEQKIWDIDGVLDKHKQETELLKINIKEVSSRNETLCEEIESVKSRSHSHFLASKNNLLAMIESEFNGLASDAGPFTAATTTSASPATKATVIATVTAASSNNSSTTSSSRNTSSIRFSKSSPVGENKRPKDAAEDTGVIKTLNSSKSKNILITQKQLDSDGKAEVPLAVDSSFVLNSPQNQEENLFYDDTYDSNDDAGDISYTSSKSDNEITAGLRIQYSENAEENDDDEGGAAEEEDEDEEDEDDGEEEDDDEEEGGNDDDDDDDEDDEEEEPDDGVNGVAALKGSYNHEDSYDSSYRSSDDDDDDE